MHAKIKRFKAKSDCIKESVYIDEGLTGTSIKKRKEFQRMMQDVADGKFDLIITREVSRFARNTVDTLQQTRKLKAIGVEVWFIEDNIWTSSDDDGELRLTIMATLAQNESKKISMRVKAGQMISFQNGVFYGNGNILGYDRKGKDFVINEEQADTVRRIYDLYIEGYGTLKIKYILEQERRKTASDLTNWQVSNICRILSNSFYCGMIEYRKQYVPDYFIQKKINNHGEIDKVIVEGKHEPIISKEDFELVQKIKENRVTKGIGGKRNRGKRNALSVYARKMHCKCGVALNKRVSYVGKDGIEKYTYQCYKQLRNGTISTRIKKGLSIDGICDTPSFEEWKILVQANFIFRKLLANKQETFERALK